MDNPNILIIDDEQNMRHMLSSVLQLEGYSVFAAPDGESGLEFLQKQQVDIVLCDLKMPGMNGLQVIEAINNLGLSVTVIMMSAYATIDTAVSAMKLGAYDFITKPFKTDHIICTLNKAIERERLKSENKILRTRVKEFEIATGFERIIYQSKVMKRLIDFAKRAAQHDTTVLITGESGTGKELFAKGIQIVSPRAEKPFISINCGAVPSALLESELFGYLKGAFTGADGDKRGIFEEADGGTLFLDEIGELPANMQVKLLRVLQEKEIRPVGSTKQRRIDVRVIAATARDLSEEVKKGTFRQDLLFRLNVVELKIPPLRERREDIPLLVNHFTGALTKKLDRKVETVHNNAITQLMNYSWPGNVRELENVIERAVIYSDSSELQPRDFQDVVLINVPEEQGARIFDNTFSIKEGKRIMEHYLISKALEECSGNKSKAAQLLEISYPSLLTKIKELKSKEG